MIRFLAFYSFIIDSWAEFYPEPDMLPNIHEDTIVDQYQAITESNFYIYQAIFTTVTETTGDGGAIFIDTATNLLIESSNFIKCHSNDKGGAIFFDNTNGKSFLKMVCSINSYSSSNGNHFCLISTTSSDQCTNGMEYSSVAKLHSSTTYYGNIELRESNTVVVKNDNISNNECFDYSTFVFWPSLSSSVSYTSFENNTSIGDDSSVIYFDSNSYTKNNEIISCNVIGNTGKASILFIRGSLKISNSCLLDNDKKKMFYFAYGCKNSCTINNCTIDNIDKIGDGNVTVESESVKSFKNNLDNNMCFTMKVLNNMCTCSTFNMAMNKWNIMKKNYNIFLVI